MPKVDYKLEEGLSQKQKLCVQELCQTLRDAGFACYMVGGAVRDLLRKEEVKDLDFASNARPEQIRRIFRVTIPTGIQHGTITVCIRGESFELTTYRSEGKYTDARRPDDIRFASSLSEDLGRRDFSINALAYEPLKRELIDEHGGLADLDKKIIRAIGKAEERFYEDGLRPVRACRFAATLGFEVEPKTYLALCNSKIQERVEQVAIERFSEELWKGFRAQKTSRMIELLEKSGLLFVFMPLEQRKRRTKQETLKLLDQLYPSSSILRMAYWRYALGFSTPAFLSKWAEHLRFSRQQAKDLDFYSRYFSFQKKLAASAPLGEKTLENPYGEQDSKLLYFIRKFLSKIKQAYAEKGYDFIQNTNAYFANSVPPQNLLKIYERDPLVIKDLKVGGKDLMALGYTGVEVGRLLHKALDQVLQDPKKNQRKTLLKF